MFRALLSVFCLAIFALSTNAQEGSVRVHMNGGTIIVGNVKTTTLPIKTKYGVLQVPFDEITSMKIGIHYEDGQRDAIQKAVKSLSSGVYKERDVATKELVKHGHHALSFLPLKSSDTEQLRRAEDVQAKILEINPVVVPAYDVVRTQEMEIRGEIMVDFLEVTSNKKELGILKPKMTNITQIFVLRMGNGTLTVDAAACTGGKWIDTGMTLEPSMRLIVSAKGNVDLWPQGAGQYVATPKGYNTAGKGGQFMAGALVAKIGNSDPFLVGENFNSIAGKSGNLQLYIVESPWNNPSSGSYTVTIKSGTE